MLRIGADKISINTTAIKRPEFIREASEELVVQLLLYR
jgi:imidazole glycerol phosphate synthase subunit HisF